MNSDETADSYESYYMRGSDGHSMSELVIHNQFLVLLLSSIDKIRYFYSSNYDSVENLVPVTDKELLEKTKTVFGKRQWSKVEPEYLIKLCKEYGLIDSQNLKHRDVMLINIMMDIFHNAHVTGLSIGISQLPETINNKTHYTDLNIDKLSGAEIKSKLYDVIKGMNTKSDSWNVWSDKSMQYIFGDLMIDLMIGEVIHSIKLT
jgi:hypothetical protein